jgi:hypothetical protein
MVLTMLIFLGVKSYGPQWTAYSYAATLLGTVPAGIFALKRICHVSVFAQLSACFRPISIALLMVLLVTWLRHGPASGWNIEARLALSVSAGALFFSTLAMMLDRVVLKKIFATIRR